MSEFQIGLTLLVFGAVIAVIVLDIIDMAVAVLAGACTLAAFGVLTESDLIDSLRISNGSLALLFGGMVVARVLAKTGIFQYVDAIVLRATRGSGRRFLILLVMLIAPICAILPNATTVILLAPIIIGVSRALAVSFVGPMIIAAILSNSAGLLTLVGDPATFLVGSSIGMSFGAYLRQVSFAGLLTVLVIIPMLPILLPDIWNARVVLPAQKELPPIERPAFAILTMCVLVVMVILFLAGESLPIRLGPPSVSIIAATLALLVIYGARVEPVENIFRDIDWKTLIFLATVFLLVQAITKTGLLQSLSLKIHYWFGTDLTMVALALLISIGALSTLLANIPVVAAALIMTKGYLVAAELVPETALGAGFIDWPAATLPVFIAMMFGATLGGNATLIGASANIVSAGICANQGEHVSFMRFLRIGLPIMLVQMLVSAAYVLTLIWLH